MRIAVLVPCWNEEATVGAVVRSFSAALPGATIYVYDNNSTDRTREEAAAAGAVVRQERRQGKGWVIQRMFADVDADVYVLVDGNNTYDAASARGMIERLRAEQLDLVNGARVPISRSAFRPGHRLGNALLSLLVALLFGNRFADVMTGLRVLSRRFVKTFTGSAAGDDIQPVLVVHALVMDMPVAEVKTPFQNRPEGSSSKFRTVRHGFRVLATVLRLMVEEKPVYFFGTFTVLFGGASFLMAYPVALAYLETGFLGRLLLAVPAASLMALSVVFLVTGLIMDMVTHSRHEAKRLRYLELSPPPPLEEPPAR